MDLRLPFLRRTPAQAECERIADARRRAELARLEGFLASLTAEERETLGARVADMARRSGCGVADAQRAVLTLQGAGITCDELGRALSALPKAF